jgi:hypothetical protein
VDIYTLPGDSVTTGSMTPQVEYDIKVTVTDNNKLKDLITQGVTVTLFYVSSPTALSANANSGQKDVPVASTAGFTVGHAVIISDSLHSETNTIASITPDTKLTMDNNLAYSYTTANGAIVVDVPTSSDTQKVAILTCSPVASGGNGSGGGGNWSMSPTGGDTTWSIVAGSCVQPTLTSSTGTFKFHVIPGKVATSTLHSGKWFVYAKATDKAPSSGSNCTPQPKTMDFYSEINSLTSGTISFGQIDPGANDSAVTTPVDAKYIANESYKVQVKTDDGSSNAKWTTGTDDVTLRTIDTSPDAGEFVLKAYKNATLGSAVQIKYSYDSDIRGSTGVQTAETGQDDSATTLWISLGASDIPSGTYNGTIYFQISNR